VGQGGGEGCSRSWRDPAGPRFLLVASKGLHDVAQTSINGLVSGSYYALGAIG